MGFGFDDQVLVPLTIFRSNSRFQVLLFKMHSTDHNEILHTSLQCYCRDVCKILLWSAEYVMNKSITKFHWISNLIEISSVGWAPTLDANYVWITGIPGLALSWSIICAHDMFFPCHACSWYAVVTWCRVGVRSEIYTCEISREKITKYTWVNLYLQIFRFTWPLGTCFWKFTCSVKKFHVPSLYL